MKNLVYPVLLLAICFTQIYGQTFTLKILTPTSKIISGENLTLECHSKNSRKKLEGVEWFRNGNEIASVSNYFSYVISDIEGVRILASKVELTKLTLLNIDEKTSGMYKCKAEIDSYYRNIHRTSDEVEIKVKKRPITVKIVANPVGGVKSGENMHLKCIYATRDGEAIKSIEWLVGDKRILSYDVASGKTNFNAENKVVEVDEKLSQNGELEIKNLTLESTGKYTCKVSNMFEKYDTDTKLVGIDDPKANVSINFRSDSTQYFSSFGKLAKFQTESTGWYPFSDALYYTWYKDSNEISRYIVKTEKDKSWNVQKDFFGTEKIKGLKIMAGHDWATLQISKLTRGMEGVYEMEAVWNGDPIRKGSYLSKTVKWNLHLGTAFRLNVSKENKPNGIYAGQDIRLSCEASINKSSIEYLIWEKDNVLIYKETFGNNNTIYTKNIENAFQVDPSRSGNGVLQLKNLQRKATGTYYCKVKGGSPFGFESNSTNFGLRYIPQIEKEKINITPKSNIREGDWVNLTCSFSFGWTSDEITSIKWYKDYSLLLTYYPKRNTKFESFAPKNFSLSVIQSSERSMILTNVKTEDSGLYTCEITLAMSQSPVYSINERLNVLPKKQPYVKIQTTNKLPIRVGEPIVLICLHDDDDYKIRWYKDLNNFYSYISDRDPKIKTNDVKGVEVDLENSTPNELHLKNFTLESSGIYSCSLSTGYPEFANGYDKIEISVV